MGGQGNEPAGRQAVVAQSFERIHRANLIGMGVLPLQFKGGASWKDFGIGGSETLDLTGLGWDLKPMQEVPLTIHRPDGSKTTVVLTLRIDTPIEVQYFRHGGILPFVLRQLLSQG